MFFAEKLFKNKKRIIRYTLRSLMMTFLIMLVISAYAEATDPTLIKKLNTALIDIKKWLVKLATPAAAVAICTGVMFKKLSFGDEERMRMGDKIIRSSIASYLIILSVDMLLKLVQGFVD